MVVGGLVVKVATAVDELGKTPVDQFGLEFQTPMPALPVQVWA
jgi:hypothetical protein